MKMAGSENRQSVLSQEAGRVSYAVQIAAVSELTDLGNDSGTRIAGRGCKFEADTSADEDEDESPTADESSNIRKRKNDEEQFQKMLRTRQLEFLSKKTHFTAEEVRSLSTIFGKITALAKTPGKMDRHNFRKSFAELFGVTNSMMLDHSFNYFDIDNDGTITFSEWVVNLSVLLRGSFEEQIEYCYRVYDLDGDESITRTEVMSLVQGSMLNIANLHADDEDGDRVTELTDMLMKKLDTKNGNGLIPLRKFRRAVKEDPLLVQCLGPCLAEPRKIQAFLSTMTKNYISFSTNYTRTLEKDCSDSHHQLADPYRNKEKPQLNPSARIEKGPQKTLQKRYSVATISNAKDDGRRWDWHANHSQRKRESLHRRKSAHIVRFAV